MPSFYAPLQVDTVRSFLADDPWNGNRPAKFRIEAASGGYLAPAHAAGALPVRYAVTSELDGRARALPDALAGLWKIGRVPPERLPALLVALAPSFNWTDYIAHMTLTRFQRGFRMWAGAVSGSLLLVFMLGVGGDVPAGAVAVVRIASGVALSLAIIPTLLVVLLQRRRRRHEELILRHASIRG